MSLPLIQTLPVLPMTANERERSHWGALKREKDDWTLMIRNCPQATRQLPGGDMRLVEVVFQKTRGPLSDKDNLHFRCKSILDALTRRGWILDDSPLHIELKVSEIIVGGKVGKTVIAVSEIAEEQEAA